MKSIVDNIHHVVFLYFSTQGTQRALDGDTKAMATVTAIIDGTGSLGKCCVCLCRVV